MACQYRERPAMASTTAFLSGGVPADAAHAPRVLLAPATGAQPQSSSPAASGMPSEAATGVLAGLFGLMAGGAARHHKRHGRAGKQKRSRGSRSLTQRKFFGDVEKLNPFYEDPAETTRKKLQPRVDAITALEEKMKSKSDEELQAVTEDLRERCAKGESLDDLLPEAFAAVREASWRVLGLRHFDVQLMGGIALHEGNIAEMGTGEGKTLVAILPAYLNSLKRKGVHVVTVNDYLARRDAEWVGQPLRFLGVSVGVVQSGMTNEQKQKAYRCECTYVTNSELGFDYLRDQMAPAPGDLVLRERDPFQFAIVDEVDSILIDEARTPLIISGEANQPGEKYQVALEVAKALRKGMHYTVEEKTKQCTLIEDGVEAAVGLLGKDDLFDPTDPWFPFITNALNAKELYLRDKSYIVKGGEIMIVDEFTGRVMDGRRWSNGLHQAIEAKEGVEIKAESVTLASISYQSLFRLFNKLAGMTGTAATEAKEFKETYNLDSCVIPPNRQRKREDLDDQVFMDDVGKWKAVAREIEGYHRIGRPVLVGTTSVENSEIVAEFLDYLDVKYQLLNAKPENVTRETEIIASSGRKGAVTISTNMAGRGTDILLGGNASMMARIKLREVLFGRLFPETKGKWVMPLDFYPTKVSKDTVALVKEKVVEAAKAWRPEVKMTVSSEGLGVEGDDDDAPEPLTELLAEDRISTACSKSPVDDDILLGLREAYRAIEDEYKQITEIEKAEVVALGGLYVIGTERHESRRIDNQLRGRSARQGDVGQTRFFLSLNDQIFRIFGGDNIKAMMSALPMSSEDTPLESGLLSNSLEEAQKKVENYFYSQRKNVFEYDEVMDTQRKIVYELRRKALLDDDEIIRQTMREFMDRVMEDFVEGNLDVKTPVETWPLGQLAKNIGIFCAYMQETVTEEACTEAAKKGEEGLTAFLQEKASEALDSKFAEMDAAQDGLSGIISRAILLMQIDSFWQKHLQNMDFLRSGVSLRAYGQKNPLTEYKLEGYNMFLKIMARIRRTVAYNIFLFKSSDISFEAPVMEAAAAGPASLPEVEAALEKVAGLNAAGAAELGLDPTKAQGAVQQVMADPAMAEVVKSFSTNPAGFLDQMKAAKSQEGWTQADVDNLKEMYKSTGIDIETLLAEMSKADDLPPEQREVVDFLQSMFEATPPSDSSKDSSVGVDAEESKVKL
eukprot:CAMPEP_0178386558 /NCGR_PEP_ID=MMETSP0689_2-20121128/8624_1 /TAXON_ID=160604 /ORGANISM="Amphidinium massartii, Strain CS-259" /LENGTH=1184 /DNA_ID=CAMNT_0020006903 /DNA_START=1 /DNA_END=3555 /DNA_ORIENTATION=+